MFDSLIFFLSSLLTSDLLYHSLTVPQHFPSLLSLLTFPFPSLTLPFSVLLSSSLFFFFFITNKHKKTKTITIWSNRFLFFKTLVAVYCSSITVNHMVTIVLNRSFEIIITIVYWYFSIFYESITVQLILALLVYCLNNSHLITTRFVQT